MVLPDDQLAPLLVQEKILDQQKIDGFIAAAKKANVPLRQYLLDQDAVTDEVAGQLEAKHLKLPFVALSKLSIPDEVAGIIPERLSRTRKVIAFSSDGDSVKIASANPADAAELVELIGKKTGKKPVLHYATPTDVENVLAALAQDLQRTIDNLLKEDIGQPAGLGREDPPVSKIVDILIESAYQSRASDIHIEPQEHRSLVRFRVDGVLRDILSYPKSLNDRVTTRIKVLANLRTDEHYAAQDGKIRMSMGDELLDIRVSIIPVADGEKIVMRLLSSRARRYTLAGLGMNEADLKKLTAAFGKSYGMILSTGPTGSGKTTTIYAILKIINTPEKNVTTIEDPIEYRVRNANQIQVNTKTGLTFANGLRSILRQDPNVIFVGEIRDRETAGIAVNASLTGHLVLSTLHTNDAATALPRLIDMGVEPYLVASTVTVIVAQRLVRKLCTKCKTATELDVSELSKQFPTEMLKKVFGEAATTNVYKAVGCRACRMAGYTGRVGLFEVLEVTPKIRKLIIETVDAAIITKAATEDGMTPIILDGLRKVADGTTTLQEVLRVTKTEFL